MLVATPSAILRNTDPYFLEQVHTAIVDEADMLLDGGFVTDVTRILDFLCPRVSNTAIRRLSKEGKTAEDGKAELPRQPAQATSQPILEIPEPLIPAPEPILPTPRPILKKFIAPESHQPLCTTSTAGSTC